MSTIRAQRAPRVRAALMRRRKAAAEFISFFADPASSPQVRKRRFRPVGASTGDDAILVPLLTRR